MKQVLCPTCGSGSVIGVEVSGVYDGVLFWRCENRHAWHRFRVGHVLRERAAPFVTEPDAHSPEKAPLENVASDTPPGGTR